VNSKKYRLDKWESIVDGVLGWSDLAVGPYTPYTPEQLTSIIFDECDDEDVFDELWRSKAGVLASGNTTEEFWKNVMDFVKIVDKVKTPDERKQPCWKHNDRLSLEDHQARFPLSGLVGDTYNV
jgi:hypothetical protein